MTIGPDLQQRLPLLPAVFHIMLALADGEKHGYAIKREVEFSTAGVVSLGPGALYGTLHKMLGAQLIEECGDLADVRRRFYRLTKLGRRLASAEAARLESLVRVARSKAILTSPEPLR